MEGRWANWWAILLVAANAESLQRFSNFSEIIPQEAALSPGAPCPQEPRAPLEWSYANSNSGKFRFR